MFLLLFHFWLAQSNVCVCVCVCTRSYFLSLVHSTLQLCISSFFYYFMYYFAMYYKFAVAVFFSFSLSLFFIPSRCLCVSRSLKFDVSFCSSLSFPSVAIAFYFALPILSVYLAFLFGWESSACVCAVCLHSASSVMIEIYTSKNLLQTWFFLLAFSFAYFFFVSSLICFILSYALSLSRFVYLLFVLVAFCFLVGHTDVPRTTQRQFASEIIESENGGGEKKAPKMKME